MRYLTFSTDAAPDPRLGVEHAGHIVDVRSLGTAQAPLPGTLLELIQQGQAAWPGVADAVRAALPGTGGVRHLADAIHWHAPIPRPSKNVFCVGRNYASHAEESARARGTEVKIPEIPMFFTKAPTTVTGPFDEIPWEGAVTQQVDWEAELAVVIGTAGRNLRRGEALGHVFGYTVLNDVTARDLQKSHGQFFKGKSLDRFCPMGPVVVTADEFGDPQRREVALRVNGVVKQSGHTRHMIFPVDVLIESLSRGLTIEPGDLLATGTPEGVGFARTPPEFLQHGDVMETEVEGIGVMRNRITRVG